MCSLHNDKDISLFLVCLDKLLWVFRIIASRPNLISLPLISPLLALSLCAVLACYRIIEHKFFPEILRGINPAFGCTALGRASCEGNRIIVFEVVFHILFRRFGIVSRICILIVSVVVLLLPPLDIQQRFRVFFIFPHCHFNILLSSLFFLHCSLFSLFVSPLLSTFPLVDIDVAELLDVYVIMALCYFFAVLF